MVRVGASRCSLVPLLPADPGCRRALEARCLALLADPAPVVLFSLDLIELSLSYTAHLAQAVAERLHLEPSQVLIHTTHTHTAPWDRDRGGGLELEGLGAALVDLAEKAVAAAVPCSLSTGATDVGSTLSINRRADTGTELGWQTFWFGYQFREGDERPDASALVNEMRARWLRQPSCYEPLEQPVWFDHPVDPLVQAMRFIDTDGKTVASLVRFCAHPHSASHCRSAQYDPDYPGVVCDTVEEQFGGICLFLLGPSANLVPKERTTYTVDLSRVPPFPYMGPISTLVPSSDGEQLREMERIGRAVGDAAVDALTRSPSAQLDSASYRHHTVAVPLNPDLPTSETEIKQRQAVQVRRLEELQATGAPVRTLRETANTLNWLLWAGYKGLHMLGPETTAAGSIDLPVAALRLNGTPMVFLPSEIPLATTRALRTVHPDLWVISLTGGSIEYIPTAEMIAEGGYEGLSTSVSEDGERVLREAAAGLIRATLR